MKIKRISLLLVAFAITGLFLAFAFSDDNLHHAACHGNIARVRSLLSGGIDVNIKDNNGMTPLWLATQNGHADIVRALISGGADVNAVTPDGETALMMSAYDGQKDTIEAVLAAGADVLAKNPNDWT